MAWMILCTMFLSSKARPLVTKSIRRGGFEDVYIKKQTVKELWEPLDHKYKSEMVNLSTMVTEVNLVGSNPEE